MKKITSPESFFGFKMGTDRKLARWDKIVEYFYLLEKESDRIKVENIGPSTEGNDFLKVTITSPDNLKNLEEIRQNNLKIADPRGLSKEELDKLTAKGKAVTVQSMSLHGAEIGGTQTAPELAYELCARNTEKNLRILDDVIFIMVPCFNPDGEIMTVDFYNEYLGTDYEGAMYPKLYHKYAGHDNNRDAFAQNLIESKYMIDILIHEWMPQSYLDHHHHGPYSPRMSLPPYKDPIRPYVHPLVWRETSVYGAHMGFCAESEGLDGVSNGIIYNAWGHLGFHRITCNHNIAGMLTEAASANLATPKYIHPTQLKGNGDFSMPVYEPQNGHPNPWPGGWWTLRGIVDRFFSSAYALLDSMSLNREMILQSMAEKALAQTTAGADNEIHAYIIPDVQHDSGTTKRFIDILLGQNIEVYEAKEEFKVKTALYGAGTKVVFLNQPKYALIMALLESTYYPSGPWTTDKNGVTTPYDVATDNVAEYMGIEIFTVNTEFEGNFVKMDPYAVPKAPETVEKAAGYILSGKENDSYHTVNLLLEAGCKVYRINACPWKDFYVEADEAKMNEVLAKAPAKVRAAEKKIDDMTEVKPAKVAMYRRYFTGNMEAGWTQLLFDRRAFNCTDLYDKDIISGALKGFDVLIIPGDDPSMLDGYESLMKDPKFLRFLPFFGVFPPEYRSGLGKEGAAAIKAFVENGGKVLAIAQSCDYIIDVCDLPVKNVVRGLSPKDFKTHGSTLHINVDNTDPIAYGMPDKALAVHYNDPVLEAKEMPYSEVCKVVASYPKAKVLKSGMLAGAELVGGKAAVMRAECGKGSVVLYGFAPQWRAQSHGTFKLLLNMMYS